MSSSIKNKTPQELRKELDALCKPIMTWLYNNYNPHVKVIINSATTELVEGCMSIHSTEFEQFRKSEDTK